MADVGELPRWRRSLKILLDTWPFFWGNAFEFYEFSCYSYMAPYIARVLVNNNLLVAWLLQWLVFLARPVGGLILGGISDTFSRKCAMVTSLIGVLACTIIQGCVPTFCDAGSSGHGKPDVMLNDYCGEAAGIFGVIVLVIARIAQGAFTGGEMGNVMVLMFESVDVKDVGFSGSLCGVSGLGGMLLGSGIATLLTTNLTEVQMLQFGWRIPFLLVLFPGTLLVLKRNSLPIEDKPGDEIGNQHDHEQHDGVGPRLPSNKAGSSKMLFFRSGNSFDLDQIAMEEEPLKGQGEAKGAVSADPAKTQDENQDEQHDKAQDKTQDKRGTKHSDEPRDTCCCKCDRVMKIVRQLTWQTGITITLGTGISLSVGALTYVGTGGYWVAHVAWVGQCSMASATPYSVYANIILTFLPPVFGILADACVGTNFTYIMAVLVAIPCSIMSYWVVFAGSPPPACPSWQYTLTVFTMGVPLAALLGVSYTHLCELFKANVRASFVGFAWNLGMLLGGIGSLVGTAWREDLGSEDRMWAPSIFVAICCGISLVCAVLLRLLHYHSQVKVAHKRIKPY